MTILLLLLVLGFVLICLAFLVASGDGPLALAAFLGAVGGALVSSSVVRLIFEAVSHV